METLLELIQNGTLIQGSVTIMLCAADIYLVIQGITIPDLLGNSTLLVLGFWFGAQSKQLTNKGAK